MILKGNLLFAPELGKLECLPNGCLRLNDAGVITEICKQLPEDAQAEEVVDYGDKLIMQSFADMHVHAPQYPMAAMGLDLPLLDWLNKYAFPQERRLADTEYARKIYRRLAQDLIAGGTTRVVMFSSLHTDATLILMEELEKAGISGYVGKVNMDRNGAEGLQETTEESIRETERWLEECKRFTQIRPILTPRFTPSCTDELMEWLGKTAVERDLPVQSHLSENDAEIEWVRNLHPDCAQYWETYAKYGMWKKGTVMAHCVHSDARERAAMKEHGVWMIYCAQSNANICSGTAAVRQMLDEGISVALGSDVAGGAHLFMVRVMEDSIRSSKIKQKETGLPFLTTAEAYYLAGTAGHRYFGAKSGFSVGDKLHAVVLDDSRFAVDEGRTLEERLERAIYLAQPTDILAVYAEGKKVK